MCKVFGLATSVGRQNDFGKLVEVSKLLTTFWRVSTYDNKDGDASGFFAWSGDRLVSDKEPVPGSRFCINNKSWKNATSNLAKLYICHARGAMSPAKDNRNNHPFVGDRFAVMHEGWVNAHHQIAAKYGLKLDGQCDSEIWLRLMEHFRGTTLNRLVQSMGTAGNAPSIVCAIDHGAPAPAIWLLRNKQSEKPLFVLRSKRLRSAFFVDSLDFAKKAIAFRYGDEDISKVFPEIDRIGADIPTKLCWDRPMELITF